MDSTTRFVIRTIVQQLLAADVLEVNDVAEINDKLEGAAKAMQAGGDPVPAQEIMLLLADLERDVTSADEKE